MKILRNAPLLVLLALCWGLAAAPAWADQDPGGPKAQPEPPGPLVERLGGRTWWGRIHWGRGYIEVEARAQADPAKVGGRTRAKLLTLKAARYRAFLRLMEVTKGVLLDDRGALGGRLTRYRHLGGAVQGAVRGAQVVREETRLLPNGKVLGTVRLRLPMRGRRGLSGRAIAADPRILKTAPPVSPKAKPKPVVVEVVPKQPPKPVEKEKLKPAAPKLEPKPQIEAKPKPVQVKPATDKPKAQPEPVKPKAEKPKPKPAVKPAPKVAAKPAPKAKPASKPVAPKPQAVAPVYTGLIVSASGLGAKPAMFPLVMDAKSGREVFGPNHVDKKYAIEKGVVGYAPSVQKAMGFDRVGKNPLVVKAIKVEGLNKAKLVIAHKDAVKVFAADTKGGFLKKCGVVIVIN